MRVTLKNSQPGHHPDGIINHEHIFEPIRLTLTGPELAALVNNQEPQDAFAADARHTITVFPPEMPDIERKAFEEKCAGSQVEQDEAAARRAALGVTENDSGGAQAEEKPSEPGTDDSRGGEEIPGGSAEG